MKKTGHALIFPTLYGYSAVLYRESPFALFRTFLPRKRLSDLTSAIQAQGRFQEGSHEIAHTVSRSIIDYFEGRPQEIKWPPWSWLDFGQRTPLQRGVLEVTAGIPYGKQRSYRDIAVALGRPKACRFVGSALAKNPFPLLIPCHRVIRSDGTPGRFGGGTALKQALIELEQRHALSRNSEGIPRPAGTGQRNFKRMQPG